MFKILISTHFLPEFYCLRGEWNPFPSLRHHFKSFLSRIESLWCNWWRHRPAVSAMCLRQDKFTWTTESCGGKGMAQPLSQGESALECLSHSNNRRAHWPLPWKAFIAFLGTLHWGWSSFNMHGFELGGYFLQKTKERVLLITSKEKDIFKCKGTSGCTGYTRPWTVKHRF